LKFSLTFKRALPMHQDLKSRFKDGQGLRKIIVRF